MASEHEQREGVGVGESNLFDATLPWNTPFLQAARASRRAGYADYRQKEGEAGNVRPPSACWDATGNGVVPFVFGLCKATLTPPRGKDMVRPRVTLPKARLRRRFPVGTPEASVEPGGRQLRAQHGATSGMMPRLTRRAWIVGVLCVAGCNYPLIRSQNPEEEDLSYLADAEPDDDITELIGQSTVPMGLKPLKIQGVGLVNGLADTGSNPAPSSYKNSLIGEMQSYDVKNPEKLLESLENSLVIVRGWLPAGVEKGDPYDVEVIIPPKSKTTSLRNGFLMRSRMREMRYAEADNTVHSGSVSGLAQGQVIVDAVFLGEGDEAKEIRGRVIGGGQSQITRPLGIAIRGEKSVKKSAAIGAAINARFQRSDRNGQTGVATPKRDNYIELAVHPRYKYNLARYVMVIRNIAVQESPSERVMRIAALERRLLEPTTSARAALQLEAIGEEGVPALLKGLSSTSREVRFYSAEALGYLDHEEAAPGCWRLLARSPHFAGTR